MPFTDLFKNEYWNNYIKTIANYEKRLINTLDKLWAEQTVEALSNLPVISRDDKIVDKINARQRYVKLVTPIMIQVFINATKRSSELLLPATPHRGIKVFESLTSFAMTWLNNRITWAAEQISDETELKLREQIIAGSGLGEDVYQISDRIRNTFEGFSQNRSEMIARTETMMAANQGTLDGYKQSSVVTEVEFYAAMDERSCEDCDGMNGEIFSIDNAYGVLPLHPHCRCSWLPVIE